MRPLPFVWPYLIVFWPTVVWAFGIESVYMRRALAAGGGGRKTKDAGSMWIVVVGNYVASVIAFAVPFFAPRANMSDRIASFWLGLAILVAGSLLRRHCFRVLGQYFTYDVQSREEQPVIETGAYRWIRHPSYTGGIPMFVGIGVAIGNWVSLAILFMTICGVYAYRVRLEERALLASMGERYAAYIKRTRRFIPFVV